MPRGHLEGDYIDEVRGQWDTIFPGLDTSMVTLMGRISRIAQVVQARSDAVRAAQGIACREFDVISLLARHGGTLSPTRVSTELIISGAGVTKRLKRPSSAGFIIRIPDPADGRGSLVRLAAEAMDLLRPILESVLGFVGRLRARRREPDQQLTEAPLPPWSRVFALAGRYVVALGMAGSIGVMSGLGHHYWAMVAAAWPGNSDCGPPICR
ncbi:DNA-binding transcriptional regulator, MarR family [Brevibacterium sp. 239c]|uniref:MarR family winged helix-turn-helix transcriptional regulator n=1 Tax=Brevibacterium sp. 239c TaxID=1965356 RepID=UPI000C60A592|nr:MarR family transcriptional regulator [Brevibacterium sp. 239c]SMX71855.1 DNA-binding transcriptional regulator, MarR family [Brevibacterium sp. 239c]